MRAAKARPTVPTDNPVASSSAHARIRTSSGIVVLGQLELDGTAANPVVMTSYADDSLAGDSNGDGDTTRATAGDWDGIMIWGSPVNQWGFGGGSDTPLELDHLVVKYAQGVSVHARDVSFDDSQILHSSGSGLTSDSANVDFKNGTISDSLGCGVFGWGGQLSVSGSQIKDSGGAGLSYYGLSSEQDDLASSVSFSGNQIDNSGEEAIFVFDRGGSTNELGDLRFNPAEFQNNQGSGNERQFIRLAGLVLDGVATWDFGELSLPVVIGVWWTDGFSSGIAIPSGSALDIPPGTVMKFDGYSYLDAHGGPLVARGTPSKRIVFTDIDDDTVLGDTDGDGATPDEPGLYWFGIRGSDVDLDNVKVIGAWDGLSVSPPVSVTNSEIHGEEEAGIAVYSGNEDESSVSQRITIANNRFVGPGVMTGEMYGYSYDLPVAVTISGGYQSASLASIGIPPLSRTHLGVET